MITLIGKRLKNMIDECDGCVKQIFADNWVDFLNDYWDNHPEFVKAYKEFKIKRGKT